MKQAHRSRYFFLVALAASGALLTACGGSDAKRKANAQTDGGAAAKAIPADALAFVDVNIDPEAPSWKAVETQAQKFPGYAKLVTDFKASLSAKDASGGNFDTDIKPWLGGEAGLAVLSVNVSNAKPEPEIVVYVESKDDDKLAAGIVAGNKAVADPDVNGYKRFHSADQSSKMFAAVGDGALLLGTTQAGVDAAVSARKGEVESLADVAGYKEALAAAPDNSLAIGYVNGPQLSQIFQLALAAGQQAASAAGGAAAGAAGAVSDAQLEKARQAVAAIESISFSFGATDKGFVGNTFVRADQAKLQSLGLITGKSYSPTLADAAPADSFAYLSFADLGPMVQGVLAQLPAEQKAQVDQALGGLSLVGLDLVKDIVPLTSGEHGVFVAPGTPVSAGLLLHPADAAAGAATLRKVTGLLGPTTGLTFADTTGGQEAAAPDGSMKVSWQRNGDALLIGVNADGTSGLGTSATYKDALAAAGVPDQVRGLLWLSVPGAITFAGTQAGAADKLTGDAKANADHLGSVVAWSAGDGDTMSATLFVEVK